MKDTEPENGVELEAQVRPHPIQGTGTCCHPIWYRDTALSSTTQLSGTSQLILPFWKLWLPPAVTHFLLVSCHIKVPSLSLYLAIPCSLVSEGP